MPPVAVTWMFLKERIMKPYFDIFLNSFFTKQASILSLVYNSHVGVCSRICAFTKFSNSTIGNYSFIGPHSLINNTSFGSYCSVGMNVKSGLGFHPAKFISTSPVFYKKTSVLKVSFVQDDKFNDYKRTDVGNDVWIGADALLIDGIKIGHGAIVGAKSVVTKDVPPYAIVAGIPAKIIKFRFDEIIVEKLLELEWWKYDLGLKSEAVAALFNSELTEELLMKIKENLVNSKK